SPLRLLNATIQALLVNNARVSIPDEPPTRRRPIVPPLADLDAPGRTGRRFPLWTPGDPAKPEPVDEEAQRTVAQERAAIARVVLAERAGRAAAAGAPVDPGPAPRPAPRRRSAWPAAAALAGAAVLVAARLWLVGTGALFGTGPVRALDVVVGAAVLLAVALSWDLLPARTDPATVARRVAVLLAVPLLVAGALTLLVPATPASAPAAGCPAAPVHGAGYVAVTTTGATARGGPGRSYATSDRFPAGCAIGFAGYCLGDPVPDPIWPFWSDARWLLVERAGTGAARLVARHLSGEPGAPRFLPSSALTAADPSAALPLLTTAECGRDGIRAAGETVLDDVRPGPLAGNLSATAARSTNLGFAVWVAPDPATGAAPLLRGDPYQQVDAGAGGPGGRRAVTFDYRSLILDLDLGRRTPEATIALLAVPCDAPSAPADPGTAALTTYSVTGVRLSAPTGRLTGRDVPEAVSAGRLRGLDLTRLTTAACATPR
ncbi:MAG TPA: hypothetical protein VF109_04750, partial [Mycobacteriales bacterium]